jgi:quinolinate synthase
MKMNTLEKLYRCLQDETPEILMDSKLMDAARLPIERMFELS